MTLIFPGDIYSKDSDRLDIIDQSIILHRKKYLFTAVGIISEFQPLQISSKFINQLYYPIKDHPVVGTVIQRCSGGFLVDINNNIPAFVAQSDTQKSSLQPGDFIAGVVKFCKAGHQTQLKVQKQLLEGRILQLSPHKSSKILNDQFMVQISKYVKFDCFIGINGMIWVGNCSQFEIETVFDCLRCQEDEIQEVITRRRIYERQSIL
ncbi:Exosome complex RNA-binding protein Rrp4 [Spironucleus salmonicida]|uniref:Exosome complex RNA-binding protein Rrp4 n=1 Tax=Spironucleus salmonicida TaxID=348837 RepID=V6LLY0_9EUKA|nr:Exosome complex RNA-binding protein Rrp4 [Spironucleus salmonicida]|eukprot:EST45692.1 Exosome complex RNA-binding protein Rrp4 [Spironucleus salmonicida]